MKKPVDSVEREYERAILIAVGHEDCDLAYELSIGLKQYQELYKEEPESLSKKGQ